VVPSRPMRVEGLGLKEGSSGLLKHPVWIMLEVGHTSFDIGDAVGMHEPYRETTQGGYISWSMPFANGASILNH
jgi:hypothetical protein